MFTYPVTEAGIDPLHAIPDLVFHLDATRAGDTAGQWHALSVSMDDVSGDWIARQNGTWLAERNGATFSLPSSIFIGQNAWSGFYGLTWFVGSMKAVVLYGRALTTEERATAITELQSLYA